MLKFLFILIILVCLGGTAYMFFFFDNKVKEFKRQILTLKNQLNKLKSASNKTSSTLKEIKITYNIPNFKYGVTMPYTAVYLAPLDTAPLVNKIKEKLQVEILDEAFINNETWYYSYLGLSSNINSKGWIRKSQFSMFKENSSEIIRNSYR